MDAAAATALPQQSSPAPRLTDLYDQEIAAQTAAPSTALADAIPERTSADAIELLREAPVEQAARSVAEIIAQSTYAMVARASAGQPDLRSLVGKA